MVVDVLMDCTTIILCFGWEQTLKDGPVSGGILQQNIGKVDAELILRQTEHY